MRAEGTPDFCSSSGVASLHLPPWSIKNRITGEHDCQAYFKTTSLLTSQLQPAPSYCTGLRGAGIPAPLRRAQLVLFCALPPFFLPGPCRLFAAPYQLFGGPLCPPRFPPPKPGHGTSLLDMVTLFSVPGSQGSPRLYRKPRGLHAGPASLRTWPGVLGVCFSPLTQNSKLWGILQRIGFRCLISQRWELCPREMLPGPRGPGRGQPCGLAWAPQGPAAGTFGADWASFLKLPTPGLFAINFRTPPGWGLGSQLRGLFPTRATTVHPSSSSLNQSKLRTERPTTRAIHSERRNLPPLSARPPNARSTPSGTYSLFQAPLDHTLLRAHVLSDDQSHRGESFLSPKFHGWSGIYS